MRAGTQKAKSGASEHPHISAHFGSLPAMQIQRRQEAGGPLSDRALPSVTRRSQELNSAW